ncbi:fasciclin domain-containing protein [Anianabacter salinae]|uniref:fasciclin domain-containing protein n=1 Tax=Anianabacter salinae TaxID=2851023 RepID=UPI00225E4544|nr:fasciclin domain-containing protein [Anianabacter salinae]
MDSDMSDEEMAMVDDVPRVGGAPMFPSRTIVENAVNSADHTTLVAAVQAAGLVDVLSSEGPFTVFAPVNAAFDALPAGTVETLLQPENKDTLTKVLTAHVVAGTLTADEIRRQERASRDGFYHLTTISGDALSARVVSSGNIYIYDESGNAYVLTQTDVMQSNGVIHVIEGVLLPK